MTGLGTLGFLSPWILLALAHAQLAAQEGLTDGEREQHRAEARRLYEKADKQIDEWYPAAPTDPRAHPIWEFRQEARKLIGPKEEK